MITENALKDLDELLHLKDNLELGYDTFDELTYVNELDDWMKKEIPKFNRDSAWEFFLLLLGKIELDSLRYGVSSETIGRLVSCWILYDFAFVGKSLLFFLFFESYVLPGLGKGNFENTITQTGMIKDKSTGENIETVSYYVDQKSDTTVIIHGGFRMDWSTGMKFDITELIYSMGVNLLVVDNRATGKSGGTYITLGKFESEDVSYWINNEVEKKSNVSIVIAGLSMGASAVMSTLTKDLPDNVKGLFEDCGFASTYDEFYYLCSNISKYLTGNPLLEKVRDILGFKDDKDVRGLLLEKLDALFCKTRLKISLSDDLPLKGMESKCAKTFVHGTKDSVVPVESATRLCSLSKSEYNDLLLVEGANHGESITLNPDGYKKAIEDLLGYISK